MLQIAGRQPEPLPPLQSPQMQAQQGMAAGHTALGRGWGSALPNSSLCWGQTAKNVLHYMESFFHPGHVSEFGAVTLILLCFGLNF